MAFGTETASKLYSFKHILLFLFVLYVVIHAVAVGIEDNWNIDTMTKSIGKEIYSPLESEQTFANGVNSTNFVTFIWSLYEFYADIYILYLFISLFAWIIEFLCGSSIPSFVLWLFALLIFYGIEMIYYAVVLKQPMTSPFIATVDIFKGIYNLFIHPNISLPNFSSNNSIVVNSCSGKICTI